MNVTARWVLTLIALLGVAGCSSNAAPGTAASTHVTTQSPSGSSPPTSAADVTTSPDGPASTVPVCARAALRLTVAYAESLGTGQHAALITLRNVGHTTCRLKGYPQLTALDDSGKALPFRIRYGGSQSVTDQQPVTVVIRPAGTAFVTFGKYRCDVGDKAPIQAITVTLPDVAPPVVLDLTSLRRGLTYCGPGDPGSELAVSPVESTAAATTPH